MRKLSKRFFALAMALVMVLSCTAFASAAEPETSDTPTILLPLSAGIARDSEEVFRGFTGQSFGSSHSGDYKKGVHLDTDSYFTIVVSSRTSCTVTVTGNVSNKMTVPSTNGESVQRSLGQRGQVKFPAGDYLVQVQFSNPNESYAFVLSSTDYWHYS